MALKINSCKAGTLKNNQISLDNRVFAGVQNSSSGEVSAATRFYYHEVDGSIWAEYSGGSIVRGNLLGTRRSADQIAFAYQQINRAGQLMTGENVSDIELLSDGRLRLHETWRWTSGDRSSGTSVVEEIRPDTESIATSANFAVADDYQSRIRGYVEGKDALEMQRDAPDSLAALIRGVAEEELHRRPAPEKWSVAEIVAHLADDELVSAWRYRQMIEHPGCDLGSFDQDLWARLGKYEAWTSDDALDLFRLLRAANLRVLSGLEPDEWEKFGFHPERGKITVRDLSRHMAGHDMNHIAQIRRILQSKLHNS